MGISALIRQYEVCERGVGENGVREKMIDLRIGQWGESRSEPETSLDKIKQLLSMDIGDFDPGWDREPARLFSIDVAMLVVHRLWDDLDVDERHELTDALQGARRSVMEGNDSHLDSLQASLEPHLAHTSHRGIWLTAMNALLPSPYRAAEATLCSALGAGTTAAPDSFSRAVSQRLEARLGEGMLMRDEAGTLFAGV